MGVLDHLLNCSGYKEPSADDELSLGPTLTQETSPVVDSKHQVANIMVDSNLSTPETVTSSLPIECCYLQRLYRKPDR